MIKIAKFGGSSVASAAQFRKVKDIVESDPDRRFVVVSAAGKRFSGDNKVTDLLLLVNAHIQYHVDCTALLADIEQRFVDIADELGLKWPVHEKFELFAKNIKKHSPEYIVARGEWFTAHLMAEYLQMPFVDAADVVVFHHNGEVDMERTAVRLKDVMVREGSFVLPGFYGATVDGQIKLFQRGGGDITGAILARCIDAGLYENWTDVSGFLSADPRIVEHPRSIRRITFDEMRELSYMGASVLQEEAIFPVREVNIPIQIKNTNRPDKTGTVIREKAADRELEHLITGIAGKKGFCALSFNKRNMPESVGFCSKILSVFEKYGISVEPGELTQTGRSEAVRYFLTTLTPDGKPLMLLDPRCTMLIEAFTGGYHRKVVGSRVQDEPEKNEYSHLMDCLAYICAKLYNQKNSTIDEWKKKTAGRMRRAGYM